MLRRVSASVGAAYALGYLVALGDIGFGRGGGWGWQWAGDPWRWLEARGLFHFEPVARLDAGTLVWLVSPLDVLLAAALGGLVALNLHGAVSLARGRAVCGSGTGGVLAALPALLAGSACCAPGLLLLLGIPSLGALAAFFGWLVPLSVLLLVATRLVQRRRGAPAWFGT